MRRSSSAWPIHPDEKPSAVVAILFLQAVSVLTSLCQSVLYALVGAWPVMISLGVIHRVLAEVPALDFIEIFVQLLALQLTMTAITRVGKTTIRGKE